MQRISLLVTLTMLVINTILIYVTNIYCNQQRYRFTGKDLQVCSVDRRTGFPTEKLKDARPPMNIELRLL